MDNSYAKVTVEVRKDIWNISNKIAQTFAYNF